MQYSAPASIALGLFAIGLMSISANVFAGELDSFETNARQTAASEASSSQHKSAADCSGKCTSNFLEILHDVGNLIIFGGVSSLAQVNLAMNTQWNNASVERVDGEPLTGDELDVKMPLRNAGKSLLPFVRLDGTYQHVSSAVRALDYRIELGYGPAAIHFDQTRFKESNPDDTLRLTQVYGLYRMSFGSMVEFDLGLGGASLVGNERQRSFAWTLPVLVQATENVGIEFRPAWTGSVSDYDLGVLLHYHYTSLKVGYRWLVTEGDSLHGPYAGFSVHF